MGLGQTLFSKKDIDRMLRDKGVDPESPAAKLVWARNFRRTCGVNDKVRSGDRVYEETPDALEINPMLFRMAVGYMATGGDTMTPAKAVQRAANELGVMTTSTADAKADVA